MNKKDQELKKLLILHPSHYKKLSELYEKKQQFTEFDKNIYDILFDNSLSDMQKYYAYLNNLSKQMSESKYVVNEIQKPELKTSLPVETVKENVKEKTPPKVLTKTSVETQITPVKMRNKGIQTDTAVLEEIPQTKAIPTKPVTEIFETRPETVYESDPRILINDENTPNPATDHFLAEKLHETAQLLTKEKFPNNIVVDKNNKDSKYRVFYNVKTKDTIGVEILPVFESLYKDKTNIDWKVTVDEKDVEGRFLLIHENPVNLAKHAKQNKNVSKKKHSSIKESVLEKTLHELAVENAFELEDPSDIIVEKNSIDGNYRIFLDQSTGNKVAVEVQPVLDNLLNKTDELDLDVVSTVKNGHNFTVLRSRAIKRPAEDKKTLNKKKQKGGR